MKSKLLLAIAGLFLFIAGCGSDNPTPPAVRSMSVTKGTVTPGTQITVSISYRVAATKVGGVLESDPFSSIISIPAGAAYVEGSSNILFQTVRPPDMAGSCPDGRSFLVYNFNPGELAVPEGFNPFIAVLEVGLIVQLEANKGEVRSNAQPEQPSDPCAPLNDETGVTLGVKS